MLAARVRPIIAAVLVALVLGGGVLTTGRAHGATPPPTPVPPHGSLSPFPTALKTRAPSPRKPPTVKAMSYLLIDAETGQVLASRRPDSPRPVASLTKLMTALLVLEDLQPRDQVRVSADAAPPANQAGIANVPLEAGETLPVEELLYALLLQSANDAAVALAERHSGSESAFVRAMNARAEELGATHTRFASASGLDDAGRSSAADLALVMRRLLDMPRYRKIAATKFHTVPAPPGGRPRAVQSRNVLLWLYPGTVAGKTGFTSRAGYSFMAVAERDGRSLLAAALGEKGEAYSDVAELLDFGFASFEPVELIRAGQPLGTRKLADTWVAVEAGESLRGLALRPRPRDVTTQVRVTAEPEDLQEGQRIGTVTALLGGEQVGEVPLIVAEVGDAGPWAAAFGTVARQWARAAGAAG